MSNQRVIQFTVTDEEMLSLLNATSPALSCNYKPYTNPVDNSLRKKILAAVATTKESQIKHEEKR